MEKTLKKITQGEMIKRISAESNYTQYAIKDIIDCMDHVIVSMLAEANPDDGCEIKVSKHIKAGVRVLNPSTKCSLVAQYLTQPLHKAVIVPVNLNQSAAKNLQ